MSVELPNNLGPLQGGTPLPQVQQREHQVSRERIPPAEHRQEPVLENIELLVQEFKAKQPLVLTSKEMNALTFAINTLDNQYLRDHLSPAVILAYNSDESNPLTLLNLSITAENKEAVALILSYKTDLNAVDKNGNSAAKYAAKENDIEYLTRVLEAGCSPNLPDANGNTALHYAVRQDKEKIALLLKHGADPTVLNNAGHSPATYAIAVGRPENATMFHEFSDGFDAIWEKTKMLGHRFGLTDNVQIDGRDVKLEGFDPSHTWHELDRSLQEWMHDANFEGAMPRNSEGSNILTDEDMKDILRAIRKGNSQKLSASTPSNMQDILSQKPEGNSHELDTIDPNQLTALQSGWNVHSTGIVVDGDLVFKCNRGEGNNGRPGIVIYEFVEQDPAKRKALLREFAKRRDLESDAPFNKAEYFKPPYMREVGYLPHKDQHSGNCTWASAKLVLRAMLYSKLLKKGYPPDIANARSLTLYKAWTSFDRYQAVDAYMNDPYLQKDLDALKKKGIDPQGLLQSIYRKSFNTRLAPIMTLLVKSGSIDVTGVTKSGETALYLAVKAGNIDQIKALLDQGLDINKGNDKGVTPFHIACLLGNTAVINLLAEHQADINKSDQLGVTPLHIACKRGDMQLVNFLLNKEAKATIQDKSGSTPLHYACHTPDPRIISRLIEAGNPVHLSDRLGNTPLHIACLNGHLDAAKYLIEAGARPNTPNAQSKSPFAIACQWNWPALVKMLLEKGAYPSDGKTSDTHPDILQLLQDENEDDMSI